MINPAMPFFFAFMMTLEASSFCPKALGNLSVTPVELCLHCPQLLIPLLAREASRPRAARADWPQYAAGQEETPPSHTSSGKISISRICLAEKRRLCIPGGTRSSVAGSSPGTGVRKDSSSTHGVLLGQQRALQGNSSLLSVMLGLPVPVCLCFK